MFIEDHREKLEFQLKQIDELIDRLKNHASKRKDTPESRIIVSRSNGCDQYYWVDRETKKRRYAKKKERDSLRKAAQAEYEQTMVNKLVRLRRCLVSFLTHYDITEIWRDYEKMAVARKALITPVVFPREMFAEKWLAETYDSMPFYDESEFYSDRGTRVRSKSEILIANQLEQYHVPYKYEKPLFLHGTGQIRPDFICLNVRLGKELVWEHFGMMDNADYANKAIAKIHSYQQNRYIIGEDLIITLESLRNPIQTKEIRNLIETLLI